MTGVPYKPKKGQPGHATYQWAGLAEFPDDAITQPQLKNMLPPGLTGVPISR